MFCPNCGAQVENGDRFCKNCGKDLSTSVFKRDAQNSSVSENHYNPVRAKSYGGFWKRLVACIIDGLIIGVVNWFVSAFMGLGIGFRFLSDIFNEMTYYNDYNWGYNYGNVPNFFEAALRIVVGSVTISLVTTVVSWIYYAGFESSSFKATPGKLVLGMEVTDLNGQRISFLRATGRYFAKIISGLILFIGFIMAAFTEKKQALHDIIAGCLVVNKN